MNNYQIYEEVGKGRFSTVYKGRKKRTIEYFAISSVDKQQRQRVLNSVQYLRALSHPNIIKFHSWYETSNHLWVITDICSGGDLKTILELDTCFPENAIRVLGADLVAGLMYMHSRGVVYADVKPSNILMDACAQLRFYDFGLAQNVESPVAGVRVGTPSYMAPELFLDGGVHSSASDLWSLGCVLHEMATGAPPFVDKQLQLIIQKIVNDPFQRVESCGSAFNDLLERLLCKDPVGRATWDEVVSSDFWRSKIPVLPLPRQPAFESFCQRELANRRSGPSPQDLQRRRDDVMRVSLNAERNLARELKDKGDYQSGTAVAVTLDREVDFSEPLGDDDGAESTAATSQADAQLAPASGFSFVSPLSPTVGHHDHAIGTAGGGSSIGGAAAAGGGGPVATMRASQRLPLGGLAAGGGGGAAAAGRNDSVAVETLLEHPSDAAVKPIVMNGRIERIAEQKFDPADLTFSVRSATQLKALPPTELDAFVSNINRVLASLASATEKLATLCFLESLCTDTLLANALVRAPIMGTCIKMLATRTTPTNMRTLLATIVGLIFRHAAVIEPTVQEFMVIQVLVSAVEDSGGASKLRRRALASLGELLFYIATQPPATRSAWTLPRDIGQVFLRALALVPAPEGDEVAVHYAVKTIENIASIADKSGAAPFATGDVVASLLLIYSAPPAQVSNEHMRVSALCGALRLCAVDPLLIHVVVVSLNPTSYGDILSSNVAKAVQTLLSFVNQLLCKAVAVLLQTRTERHLVRRVPWTNNPGVDSIFASSVLSSQMMMDTIGAILKHREKFMNGLSSALEHSAPAIRGKACMTVLLLTVVETSFLSRACDFKLFPYLEKLGRDQESYTRRCVGLLHGVLRDFVLTAVANLATCEPANLVSMTDDLVVALHVVTSASLRTTLEVDEVFFVNLARSVSSVEHVAATTAAANNSSAGSGADATPSHVRNLFLLVEALSMEKVLVLRHYASFITHILPRMASLLRTSKTGDTRFFAIKTIYDVLSFIFADSTVFNPAQGTPAVALVEDFVAGLMPLVEQLLEEGDPIPLFTLKLLSNACDRSTTITAQVARQSIVQKLLSTFLSDAARTTIYVVRVLLRVLQSGGEPLTLQAIGMGLGPKLAAVVQNTVEEKMDQVLDPALQTMFFALYTAAQTHTEAIVDGCRPWAAAPFFAKTLLPLCRETSQPFAETAASSVALVAELFTETHAVLLNGASRAILREVFAGGDEASLQVALPLVRMLGSLARRCQVSLLQHMLRDESLLLQLQTFASNTSPSEQELAQLASAAVNALYQRQQSVG